MSTQNDSKLERIWFRNYQKMNSENFCKDLKSSPLCNETIYGNLSVDECVDLYNCTLEHLLNTHCPVVEKKKNQNLKKPKWFNDELMNLKRDKRRAERRLKKEFSIENRKKFCFIRNKYNFKLKETRYSYYTDNLSNAAKDSKALYKILNRLTGNVKEKLFPTNLPSEQTANEMAAFYFEKVKILRESIQIFPNANYYNLQLDSDLKFNLRQHASEDFSNSIIPLTKFVKLSCSEIQNYIKDMKSKTSILDPIPTDILKQFVDSRCPFFTFLVNSTFNESCFPNLLKHAAITPVIKDKNGDSEAYKNYRPVSNLSFLSKLLEKVVYDQITAHLQFNNSYAKFQSGYRKKHSCETAMFKVVGDIQTNTCLMQSTALILLDLSSAFDTLDHNILLERLFQNYAITDDCLQWIKSYYT